MPDAPELSAARRNGALPRLIRSLNVAGAASAPGSRPPGTENPGAVARMDHDGQPRAARVGARRGPVPRRGGYRSGARGWGFVRRARAGRTSARPCRARHARSWQRVMQPRARGPLGPRPQPEGASGRVRPWNRADSCVGGKPLHRPNGPCRAILHRRRSAYVAKLYPTMEAGRSDSLMQPTWGRVLLAA